MTNSSVSKESEQPAKERGSEEYEVIRLSDRDSVAFAQAVTDPPEPNDALIMALRSARELSRE